VIAANEEPPEGLAKINSSVKDFWDLYPQAIFDSVQMQPAI